MTMKRILATSAVVILLLTSSLAIACDLSCEFPQPESDCHASRASAEESMPAGMAMDGVTMPGMNHTNSGNQGIAFGQPQSESKHGLIGVMGPCERQSCDQSPTVAAKGNHYGTARFDTILAAPRFPRVDCCEAVFHDARDSLELFGPPIQTPLNISLRI